MTFFDAGNGAGVAPRSSSEESALERALLAAGCFWGVEARLRRVDGIEATEVGYSGGTTPAPTYREVCGGDSGHAEAVAVAFDGKRLDFEALLEVFWTLHNPTERDRQGADVGSQYRSAIFFTSETQRLAAERSRDKAQSRFRLPIATEITPAQRFWRAEEYHQRYFDKQRGLDLDLRLGEGFKKAVARVF